ncbi:MAG: hypothetical protein LBB07_02960 [Bifidobacteriaceae bacterium]|jgi:hypothetical protein|nr:hypothetical protein [Bifidobacteriaceae bacterium]
MNLLIKYLILNLKRLAKQPIYLAVYILSPLVLYVAGLLAMQAFSEFEFEIVAQYYLICSIVFSILVNSYLYLARNMSNDKKVHFDIVLQNNKKYFIFNLSYVIIYGLLVLASTLLLFALSFFFGGLVWSVLRYFGLLAFAFVGTLSFAFFAICAAAIPRKFFAMVGYGALFVAFLSGIFVPLAALTGGAAPFLEVIPIYSLANIGWEFIYYRIYSGLDFLFLGLWALGFFSVALIFYPQPPEYAILKSQRDSESDKK